MIEFHEIHEESTEESKSQHVNDMYDEENDEEGDAAAAPSWETRSNQTAEIAPADLLRYHEVDPQDAAEKAAEEQAAQEALKLAAEKQDEEVAKEDA